MKSSVETCAPEDRIGLDRCSAGLALGYGVSVGVYAKMLE